MAAVRADRSGPRIRLIDQLVCAFAHDRRIFIQNIGPDPSIPVRNIYSHFCQLPMSAIEPNITLLKGQTKVSRRYGPVGMGKSL